MSSQQSTVNHQEISKFERLQSDWWSKTGSLKTLHHINPARLAFIEDHCCLQGKKVLDVGCGGGILAEAISRKGALVTGIDAAASAIDVAINHARLGGLTIDYLCTPLESYQNESFSVISCMEMLEHVDNPESILQHCANILEPGGWLFLSTINRTLKAYFKAIVMAEYVLGLLPKQTHDYQKCIKPSELAAMARKNGFEVKAISGLGYNPFTGQSSLIDDVDVNYLMACQKTVD